MVAVDLDPRCVVQHKQTHASFLEEVALLQGSVEANNLEAAKSLLELLTHWLAYLPHPQPCPQRVRIAGVTCPQLTR